MTQWKFYLNTIGCSKLYLHYLMDDMNELELENMRHVLCYDIYRSLLFQSHHGDHEEQLRIL